MLLKTNNISGVRSSRHFSKGYRKQQKLVASLRFKIFNTCTPKYWYCTSDECEGLTVRTKKPSRSVKDVKSMVTSHPAARPIHLIRRLRRTHVPSGVTKLSNARGCFSGTLRAGSFTLNRVRKKYPESNEAVPVPDGLLRWVQPAEWHWRLARARRSLSDVMERLDSCALPDPIERPHRDFKWNNGDTEWPKHRTAPEASEGKM